MRIGVMLRTLDERQGIGIYTQNLLEHLLAIDRTNEYVLFLRSPGWIGRYTRYANVRERLLRAGSKLVWDQITVPLAASRERVDVLFHTKFTVPLLARRPAVMVLHGSAWFVHPELFGRLDILYVRLLMPLYCRRAAAIVANSELTRRDFVRHVGTTAEKIRTVHLAADDRFAPVSDPAALDAARRRHGLPERFALSVTKPHPLKNFGNLLRAYELCRARVPCKLVVVGANCERYRDEHRLRERGLDDDVRFLGWVEQPDLPALYSLAECLLLPSVYETFGIPACEAMACGCPVIASRTGALPEVLGDAGLFVDPASPEEIAAALHRLLVDLDLRRDLAARALRRAKAFTWERCARETLSVIESAARPGRPGATPAASEGR